MKILAVAVAMAFLALAPTAAAQTLHFHLSEPEIVMSWKDMILQENPLIYEHGFPDSPLSLLPWDNPANPRYLFSNHHRIENPLSNPAFNKKPLLPGNYQHGLQPAPDAHDRCGDWFMPTFFQDTENPELIHAYIHQEGQVEKDVGCYAMDPVWGHVLSRQTISYSYSPDRGESWIQPPDNEIITSMYKYEGRGAAGTAQPLLFEEGDYLYVFYRETGDPDESSPTPKFDRMGMTIARATKESDGKPGSWYKWDGTGFTYPAIKGDYELVIPGWENPMYGGRSNFFANLGKQYFLLNLCCGFSAALRFSDSLTSWDQDEFVPLIVPSSGSYNGVNGSGIGYPSLMFYQDTSYYTKANLFYMYKPHGTNLKKRLIIHRVLTVHKTGEYEQITQPLVNYYSESRKDTQSTTEAPIPPEGKWDYEKQETLGHVFLEPVEGAFHLPIINCYSISAKKYYNSWIYGCGEDIFIDYNGFIYEKEQPNTKPMLRCYDVENNNYFLSTDLLCNGKQFNMPFGYILQLDETPPQVVLASPKSKAYNTKSIPLDVSAEEPIAVWEYSLNSGPLTIFEPPVTITAQEGKNTLIVFATDSEANNASVSAEFTADTEPPKLSNPSPTGKLPATTESVILKVQTNEPASCKYAAAPGISYSSMSYSFQPQGIIEHSTAISGLEQGKSYSFYLKCKDLAENINTEDFLISFSVDQASAACGDGKCQSGETCSSCPKDCGSCPPAECKTGTKRPCGFDIGVCKRGTQTCVNGFWDSCEGGQGPVAEVCNQKDDNCDSIQDNINGMNSVESTGCRCYRGGAPSREVCNGIDDDCDSHVDEGVVCCEGKQTKECGTDVGTCEKGIQTCVGNSWGPCLGGIDPSEEVCNQKDDDCDSQVDEGCAPDNCSNNIKDPEEEGVDCGGVCQKACDSNVMIFIVAGIALVVVIVTALYLVARPKKNKFTFHSFSRTA